MPRAITARGDLAADEQATIALFDQASPAVVDITSLGLQRDRFSLNLFEIPQGTGSGFIWDYDGHIITNFHVIEKASSAKVTLADQSTWDARLLGTAPNQDSAVLSINAPRQRLRPIPIGSSTGLQVGQKVFALGNPFGLDQTLTTGIISALGREIPSVTSRTDRLPLTAAGSCGRTWLARALLTLLVMTTLHGAVDAAQKPHAATDPCSLPTSLVHTRPHPDREPVQVQVGVMIIDVIEINNVEESFKVDVVLQLQWQDPRLAATARGGTLQACQLGLHEIWDPGLHLINRRRPITAQEPDLDIAADGTVRFRQRILAELSSPLNLHNFPFDVQRLKIQVASFEYGPQDVRFVVDDTRTGRLEGITIQGWDILSNASDANVPTLSGILGHHTRLDHTIVLARQAGYYVWSVVVPICLIVLMAWSVFWINPRAHDAQISVATAAVFTLIAFLLSLRQLLPRVAYLTRVDQLVLASMAMVFLALGEVIVTGRLAMRDRIELARRIDRYARWAYLELFVVVVVVTLIV